MSLMPFVTLQREELVDCRVFRIDRVRRRSGLTLEERDYFQIRAGDWVNVVALTADGQLVFVRQERHGTESFTLELPAGIVEPGEDPLVAAARELAEETGFLGEAPVHLGWVHPNPALQANRCHTVLVANARLSAAPSPGEDEELEVLLFPRKKLDELVRSGAVTHALAIASFHLLLLSGR